MSNNKIEQITIKTVDASKTIEKYASKKIIREQKNISSLVSTTYHQNQYERPLQLVKVSVLTQGIGRTPQVNQPLSKSSK